MRKTADTIMEMIDKHVTWDSREHFFALRDILRLEFEKLETDARRWRAVESLCVDGDYTANQLRLCDHILYPTEDLCDVAKARDLADTVADELEGKDGTQP